MRAREVITHLGRFGTTVILTDGDVVLQPRQMQRSGLLDPVKRHYPARHYVMVDDKLRILAAMKAVWRERLTTIFPRQAHYALDPKTVATQPAPDFTIERIGELADLDPRSLIEQQLDKACLHQERL